MGWGYGVQGSSGSIEWQIWWRDGVQRAGIGIWIV